MQTGPDGLQMGGMVGTHDFHAGMGMPMPMNDFNGPSNPPFQPNGRFFSETTAEFPFKIIHKYFDAKKMFHFPVLTHT